VPEPRPEPAQVRAVVRYASGREAVCAPEPTPRPADPPWQRLTPAEEAVLAAARSGRDFPCPRCGREHPWREPRCQLGSHDYEPIYHSLSGRRGLVVFRQEDAGWAFRVLPRGVVRLDDLRLVLHEASAAPAPAERPHPAGTGEWGTPTRVASSAPVIHQFIAGSGQWLRTAQALEPYAELADGTCVLCI